ncbi:MAG: hypothetical protein WCI94_05640 [Rhodospirillales bacterium]
MLQTIDSPRQDKTRDAMTGAILDRDPARTADIFFRMIKDEGRSVPQAVATAMEAEAPFVQVPNHINVKDGQLVLINNDHTILGIRTSAALIPYMPKGYELLPMLQSIWYIPAGLDIWNQLLGKYPGRYASMKGMNVPPPDYGPTVWNQDQKPLREGNTIEERLHNHMLATMGGEVVRSYRLFLDLAADPEARDALRDQMLFLGLIDIQDTIAGRKARNTGHKALRARAIVGLADYVGWADAHGVFYTGVPDMAVGPLYYSAYDAACVMLNEAFPDGHKHLREANKIPLTPAEIESFIELTMSGTGPAVWNRITAYLQAGKSIRSLGDTIQIAAAELILRNVVPRKFTDGQHPFDYCNTANHWIRTSTSNYQPRILYLMANFVNDSSQANKWQTSGLAEELKGFDGGGRSSRQLLTQLDESIMSFDIAGSTAVANAYLQSGANVQEYFSTVAVTASKFQDDPHNQKIAHSAFQEYENNSTHLKDRLLLAAVRQLAGWPKMPGDRDCYARFMSDWIEH